MTEKRSFFYHFASFQFPCSRFEVIKCQKVRQKPARWIRAGVLALFLLWRMSQGHSEPIGDLTRCLFFHPLPWSYEQFSLGACLSFQHFLQAPFSGSECPHLSSQGQRQALRILVLLRLRWGQGPAGLLAKPAGRSDDAHCCWDVGSRWWPAGRHGRLRWMLADLEPGWLVWEMVDFNLVLLLEFFLWRGSSMAHWPWNTRFPDPSWPYSEVTFSRRIMPAPNSTLPSFQAFDCSPFHLCQSGKEKPWVKNSFQEPLTDTCIGLLRNQV